MMNPSVPCARMNSSPGIGLKACKMLHAEAMCTSPSTALTAKNVTMIGLKKAATRAVPRLWAANRRTRMTTVAGRT